MMAFRTLAGRTTGFCRGLKCRLPKTNLRFSHAHSEEIKFKPKLYYFDGRGKGETVRMMLCATGIEYDEILLHRHEPFEQLKEDGELLFDHLPLLQIDGMSLVQSGSIVRYLAEKGGLAGKTPEERVKVDMLAEGANDFRISCFAKLGWEDNEKILNDARNIHLPQYLPIFESVLAKNGTGYLVGKRLTYADVRLCEALLSVIDYFGKCLKPTYVNLQDHLENVTSLPGIQHYLLHCRKRMNDPKYINDVKTVLGL